MVPSLASIRVFKLNGKATSRQDHACHPNGGSFVSELLGICYTLSTPRVTSVLLIVFVASVFKRTLVLPYLHQLDMVSRQDAPLQ
jgi:hypothetical protein